MKPFLENKMSIFEEYGAFNQQKILLKLCIYMYLLNFAYICICFLLNPLMRLPENDSCPSTNMAASRPS